MTAERKRGRPPTGKTMQRVAVTLDQATIDKGRELGGGSLSEGIRIAVSRVARKGPKPPPTFEG